ncbi:MAG: multicopper oxidase domain-containing protein [Longimicrobiales bacterium]
MSRAPSRSKASLLALTPLLLVPGAAAAPSSASAPAAHETPAPAPAPFEDYVTPVGRLHNGVLRVTLDAGQAEWRPWGADGPSLMANAFAADGAAPRIPGPLIRVTAGTPVHVTLRNTLSDTLVVRGLRDRSRTRPPGAAPFGGLVPDPVTVPPGDVAQVHFTPTVPGTYWYFGRVLRPVAPGRQRPVFSVTRGPFTGVLIVDSPDAPPPAAERIFLITHWADRGLPGSWQPGIRFMINGRSWPHTERLAYAQGDTVHWRVINATGLAHPMHLHGFHFSIAARGDQWREDVYAADARPLAVTESLDPGQTMRIAWVAKEPGNWIFHCHLMRHMSWLQTAALEQAPSPHHGSVAARDPLGGMVLGITIAPRPDHVAPSATPRRRIPLHIGMRSGVFGDAPAYGFVVQEDAAPPAPDSVRFPGSPIVLWRGEPVEIVVHNRADVALGVHWHGLELESRGDGVPGWSGSPGAVMPAVAPRDSFVVRMTPPRAGTFMYHVHSEPGHQLAQGLYGPFLVMEPGAEWDPDTDRLLLLGSLGAELDAPPAVNGELDPDALEFAAGTTYRLRVMHISPDDDKRVRLLRGEQPVEWRAVAKDGADLPASALRVTPAALRIGVGETYDFLWTPAQSEALTLEIVTTFSIGPPNFERPGAPPPDTMRIPIRVR